MLHVALEELVWHTTVETTVRRKRSSPFSTTYQMCVEYKRLWN